MAKVPGLQKMSKKVAYFLKQKIAVIQAKSLCVRKNFKKVEFLHLEQRLFHSQERFAIAHSYPEKVKFLKQKIMFFLK